MKFTMFFVAVLMPIIVLSQIFKVEKTERVDYYWGTKMLTAGKTKTFYYNFVRTDKEYSFDAYDINSLKLIKSYIFPTENKFSLCKTFCYKNKLYVFMRNVKEKNYTYCRIVNEKGDLEGDLITLNTNKFPLTDCELSADSTTILLNSKNINYHAKENLYDECSILNLEGYSATAIDTLVQYQLSERFDLNKREIVLKSKIAPYNTVNWSNHKSVLYVITTEKEIKGKSSCWMGLVTVDFSTGTKNDITINLEGKNIKDAHSIYDKSSDKIFVTGFYSNLSPKKMVGDDIDGLFVIECDGTGVELNRQIIPLSKANVALVNETEAEKIDEDEGIDKLYFIKYIKRWEDGSLTVVAENLRLKCNDGHTKFAEKVLIISVPQNRKLCNVNVIDKKQKDGMNRDVHNSYQPNYMDYFSAFCFEKKNKLFVMYNDHKDNVTITKTGATTLSDPEKGVLVAVEIQKDGSYVKQVIQNNSEFIYIFDAEIQDNETIILQVKSDVPYLKNFGKSVPQGVIIVK